MTPLTICSKSRWSPAIRREHALALAARRRGIDVCFVESPEDVRSVRHCGPARFVRRLVGAVDESVEAVEVVARTVPVPGHRSRWAEAVDAGLLRRILAARTQADGPVVCSLPWQWGSIPTDRRRVFDCADDWTQLYPASRSGRFTDLFARIATEADEVIVASPDLAPLFGGREVVTVPNGADAESIAWPITPPPGRGSLAYVGTFSERFDSGLVSGIMGTLPGWSLDLYGPCHYAGMDDRPAPELTDLLGTHGHRVRWHGTIPRTGVAAAIDSADVVIVPNRTELSKGQSSMKLYDSAARGRPAVVSPGVSSAGEESPPGTYVAVDVDHWVDAIRTAAGEDDRLSADRVAWAQSNTWDQRWPAWAAGVFGAEDQVGAAA